MHHQPLHPVTSPEMTVSNPGGPLTVASAIPMVESWTDLSPTRRRDLISALKATAHIAALPLSNVPLTPDFLRRHVLGVSAAQYGVSTSRLSNIRALLRFVLRRADVIDAADTPVTPAWSVLLDCLGAQQRHGLIGFARFCSGRGLAPSMVSSVTLEDFLTHLLERTLAHHPRERVACVRNVWNQAYATLEGWPPHQLTLLHQPTPFIKPITAFPESFQTDLTAFRDRMAATVLDRPDDEIADEGDLPTLLIRPKPVRTSTAQQRMSHARWAASALVESGLPSREVQSLRDLVIPLARAKAIFRRIYEEAGNQPSSRGKHVAEVMRIIAKYEARLPEPDVTRIKAWGKRVTPRNQGMTQKNETTIRQALDPSRELKLMELPDVLMQSARRLRPSAPRQACFRALVGTAIKLFSRRMLRLANVSGLRLDQHLQRADPRRRQITHLYIPAEQTKNNRVVSLPVAPDIARMLEEWIRDFRPLIAAPDCVYLFPGYRTGNRPITPQALSYAVKRATREFAGIALTPHQFRHLAAHTFLSEHPGHYEEVRQQLGHASVTTTTRFYSGIESASAAHRFDAVILKRRHGLRRKPAAKTVARQAKAGSR